MGIPGLMSFVERAHGTRITEICAPPSAKRPVIVVDGFATVRTIYPDTLDWIRGGQWTRVYQNMQMLVSSFSRAGFELHFVWDGVEEDVKQDMHIKRYETRIREMGVIVNRIHTTHQCPENQSYFPPPNIGAKLRAIGRDVGVKNVPSLGEADRFLAWYALKVGAWAILSEDSDYFVLPVPRIISVKHLKFHGQFPASVIYQRANVLSLIGFAGIEYALPIAASLVGNDYLLPENLRELHAFITRQKAPRAFEIVTAVFAAVSASAKSQSGHLPDKAAADADHDIAQDARDIINKILLESPLSSDACHDITEAVIKSASQYLLAQRPDSGSAFPPTSLRLAPSFSGIRSTGLVPRSVVIRYLRNEIGRGSVQTMTLGLDRVGRIVDASYVRDDVRPVAEIVRPIREIIFGLVAATLVLPVDETSDFLSASDFLELWFSGNSAARQVPPRMTKSAGFDISLVPSASYGLPNVNVLEYVHAAEPTPVAVRYFYDSVLQAPVCPETAFNYTREQRWWMMLLSVGAATHDSSLHRMGLQGEHNLDALVCVTLHFLLSGSHVNLIEARIVLVHYIMLGNRSFCEALTNLLELSMPPLGVAALDLGYVFQSTMDCIIELSSLLENPLGNIDMPWRVFDGRVLHLAHAFVTTSADPIFAIYELVAPFDRRHPDGRMYFTTLADAIGAAPGGSVDQGASRTDSIPRLRHTDEYAAWIRGLVKHLLAQPQHHK